MRIKSGETGCFVIRDSGLTENKGKTTEMSLL